MHRGVAGRTGLGIPEVFFAFDANGLSVRVRDLAETRQTSVDPELQRIRLEHRRFGPWEWMDVVAVDKQTTGSSVLFPMEVADGEKVVGKLRSLGVPLPFGPTCLRCGYELTGIAAIRCPECGLAQ